MSDFTTVLYVLSRIHLLFSNVSNVIRLISKMQMPFHEASLLCSTSCFKLMVNFSNHVYTKR